MKESKKIEQYLIDLMKGIAVVDTDTYTKTAIIFYKFFLKLLYWLLHLFHNMS